MSSRPLIEVVSLVPASTHDSRRGLLGYAAIRVAELLIVDPVAVRRTLEDRLALSYPTRADRRGVRHPIVRPVGNEAGALIEEAVLPSVRFDQGSGR